MLLIFATVSSVDKKGALLSTPHALLLPSGSASLLTKARGQYFSTEMCGCSEALFCGMQGGELKELEVVVPRERGPAAAQCQQPLPSAAASAQGFIIGDMCKLKLMVTW